MDKRQIVEQVHRKLQSKPRFYFRDDVECILIVANYFDLLEAATDLIKQHRAMRDDKTCMFKRCECGNLINLNVRYSDKCVYCRIEEILRKAGVKVE